MAFIHLSSVTLLILLFLSPFKRFVVADDPLLPMFEKWMKDYGRSYGSLTEKLQRFQVFKDNFQFIVSLQNQPGLTFTVGLNKFADLTNEEFLRSYATYRTSTDSSTQTSTSFRYANSSIPPSVDWRALGAVNAIKDQESCGSCWAFSAVASIEGINQIKTGKLISLSEQELVDCVTAASGCRGGIEYDGFSWVAQNGGITTEDNYPYVSGTTQTQGSCDYNKTYDHAATITGFEHVPASNESALAQAVAKQPVSMAIDASGSAFQFYSGGIFNGSCGTYLNHAVNAVGYGTTTNGTNYWIVRNSWGISWGEYGYILMQKDVSTRAGQCGLALDPSYPTK